MTYENYSIQLPNGRTSGEVQTTCPNCSHERRKKTDKCLSVNLDKKTWFCHHCGWKGGLSIKIEEIKFELPQWDNKTTLSDRVVKWFESRRISQSTLKRLLISDTGNEIHFRYFHAGILKNVKYRGSNKAFRLHKGAELILYNLDAIEGEDVWITEGEMDCAAFVECGITSVVSVPNGANLSKNNLSYLDNYMYLFDGKKIHLAVDNDIAGRKLREDLADRFGRDRTNFVQFGDYKDANEFLMFEGKDKLKEQAYKFEEFPLIGVFTISDMVDDINDMYVNGLPNGVGTGMHKFDTLIRFERGYITTITGIPGHGKSDFLDQIVLKLLLRAEWRGAFYSPENKPTKLHFAKLARKLKNLSWMDSDKMSTTDVMDCMYLLDKKFWFVKPEKDFTLDTILSHVRELQSRHGLEWFAIDAWNKLEHKYDQSETKYIGESLDKLATFCENNNIHCFLVAHPTKIRKQKDSVNYEIPNLYDISGSANFFNKTDNGLTVFRNFETDTVEVHVQKVKFSHWGQIGLASFTYDKVSGRFMDEHETNKSWI